MKKIIYHKKCKWCGKEFDTPSPRQMYCKDDYGPCPVCGKQTKVKDYNIGVQCCSKECRQKRIERTCLERYGDTCAVNSEHSRKKARKTCLEKYGVDHYSKTKEYREKYTETCLERYGVENPLQNDEIRAKMLATNQERYGGNSPTCDPEVMQKVIDTTIEHHGGMGLAGDLKDQIIATTTERYGGMGWGSAELRKKFEDAMIERYGVGIPSKSDEVKERIRKTNLERYDSEVALQNPEVRAKAYQTTFEHYGVENPFASEEVQQTIHDTLMERYGVDNPLKSEDIKQRMYATNLERYGVIHPLQSSDIVLQSQLTCIKRYGTSRWTSSPDGIMFSMTDSSKYDEYIRFKTDPKSYIENNFDHKPNLIELSDATGVTTSTITRIITELGCRDFVDYYVSTMELDVIQELRKIDPDLNIIQNSHSVIYPMEIDIYLPDYKIGIECNPTFTHNSSRDAFTEGDRKSPSYHKKKSEMASANGVFIYHIFGYNWTYHKDQVVSMLRNMLHKTEHKIYARTTKIVEIDSQTCSKFLEENHLQGSTFTKIRLGLVDCTGELVSVMTFNKLRNTIGSVKSSMGEVYELSRFCNKMNFNVVGGASKLFTYFKEHYKFDEVISFGDASHVRGWLYQALGFTEVSRSAPTYCWVDLMTDLEVNRVNCQKKNLHRLFPDEDLDIENHTEAEIMISHGFVKVYDCGKIRYSYKP